MEFALEKLQRTAERVSPEERTPELNGLLSFATCMEEAEKQLKEAAQHSQEAQADAAEPEDPALFKASLAAFFCDL